MKRIILTILLLSLAFTGCHKQPSDNTDQIDATTAFEKADTILNNYIEKLDSEFTIQEVRVQILCKGYPDEYKTNYMPYLLKLSRNEYDEAILLADMDMALDHYKVIDNIQC